MASREWTPEQKNAISLRGRDLLVSAGAGSGKTSVMAERIISRICDENDPCDLDEMLIVTFTLAATGELRERIVEGLRARSAGKKLPRIKRALSQIGSARIATINSFCYSVVRRGFAKLGLSASLRIADDAENTMISQKIMDETIEAFYQDSSRYGIDDFSSFTENFIDDNDANLNGIFLEFYEKLLSVPDGVGLLKKKARVLAGLDKDNFFDSEWGMTIRSQIIDTFAHYKAILEDAIAYFSIDVKLEENYGPAARELYELACRILNNERSDYEYIRALLDSYTFPGFGRKRLSEDLKTPTTDFYKTEVKKASESVKKLMSDLLTFRSSDIAFLAGLSERIITDLGCFLSEFERRLLEKKKELGVLTFADCERYSLKLLVGPDGVPTDFALEYRDRIKEIYIDEYQDTNELQDMIFRAIARPGSRFMVGDVKQSIYAFRSAEPTLFTSYRENWEQYTPNNNSTQNSLFLSTNFRSLRSILNTVNTVFGHLFTAAGNIDYCEEDELHVPESYDKDDRDRVRIVVVNNRSDDADPDSGLKNARGAEFVAREISSLIARGEAPEDCAVLVRNKSLIRKVTRALDKYGISYNASVGGEFFKYPEVLFVVSVLQVINNPTREIHLAAVLTSPLYGLSIDDLALLRLEDREKTLYDLVSSSDDPRLVSFMRDLEAWRSYARKMASHSLIRMLYDDYGLVNYACSGRTFERKQVARINCNRLYDLALKFEGSSYKGLYAFLEYVSSLASSKMEQNIPVIENGKSVKVMNIHQSKGLEFKNCFIYTGSDKLKVRKGVDKVVFSKKLGFGAMVREKDSPVRYDTPIRKAVILGNDLAETEEELRILYVAMTRAKERLYVVSESNDPQYTVDYLSHCRKYITRTFINQTDKFGDWILAALSGSSDPGDWNIEIEELGTQISEASENDAPQSEETAEAEENCYRKLVERFNFKYPYDLVTGVPAKLSVSRLYPGVLDENDGSTILEEKEKPRLKTPDFSASGRKDAAEAGTSTHIFMQFCNFENLSKFGAEYELKRLTEESFLSAEASETVNLRHIERFAQSKLFSEILLSPRVWRERRFNVLLPASEFTNDPAGKAGLENEKVLVQGVVDCVYESQDGGLVLVDYKTDSVAGMTEPEAEKMLCERHSLQLGYYKRALEKLIGKKVTKTAVYSFGLGKTVDIPV